MREGRMEGERKASEREDASGREDASAREEAREEASEVSITERLYIHSDSKISFQMVFDAAG
jgi:hypothetical protein